MNWFVSSAVEHLIVGEVSAEQQERVHSRCPFMMIAKKHCARLLAFMKIERVRRRVLDHDAPRFSVTGSVTFTDFSRPTSSTSQR